MGKQIFLVDITRTIFIVFRKFNNRHSPGTPSTMHTRATFSSRFSHSPILSGVTIGIGGTGSQSGATCAFCFLNRTARATRRPSLQPQNFEAAKNRILT